MFHGFEWGLYWYDDGARGKKLVRAKIFKNNPPNPILGKFSIAFVYLEGDISCGAIPIESELLERFTPINYPEDSRIVKLSIGSKYSHNDRIWNLESISVKSSGNPWVYISDPTKVLNNKWILLSEFLYAAVLPSPE